MVMTMSLRFAGFLAVFVASTLTAQDRPVSDESGEAPTSLPSGMAVTAGISDPPLIDGRLDDAAWGHAVPMTGFHAAGAGGRATRVGTHRGQGRLR